MKTKILCKRYSLPKAIAVAIFIFVRVCALFLVECETKYVLELDIVYLLETWYGTYTLYTVNCIHPIYNSSQKYRSVKWWERKKMGNRIMVRRSEGTATDRDENNIHLFDLIHCIQNTWNACWLPHICIFYVWSVNW